MVNGKIVFLLILVATCVAISYAGLWIEWRNRAVAVIQSASRIRPLRCLNAERSLGYVDGQVNDPSDYSPASWRQAPLMAGPQT